MSLSNISNNQVCSVAGCGCPRHILQSGKLSTRCLKHYEVKKRYNTNFRKNETNIQGWIAAKLNKMTLRDAKKGIISDYSAKSLFNLYMSTPLCHYCGITMNFNGESKIKDDQPTFDAVDCKLGHIVGNVVVCCHKCNRSKGTLSPEDWKVKLQGPLGINGTSS